MELQLAAKLGVSRTPIREAIRMLEQEGLAITIPRKGAIVAGMTEKDMQDVLEIREALEELSVQVACDKITAEEIAKLHRNMKNFEQSLKSGDLKQMAQADVEFHDVIYQATDNPKLINMLNNLREQMYRYRLEYIKDAAYHNRLVAEHEEIYSAIMDGDEERAAKAVVLHIDNQEETIIKHLNLDA